MTAIATKLLGYITRKLLRGIAVIIMLGIYGGSLVGITALTSVATSTEAAAGKGRGRGRGNYRGRGRGHHSRRGRGHHRGRGRGRRGYGRSYDCWYPGYYEDYWCDGYGSGLNIWIR